MKRILVVVIAAVTLTLGLPAGAWAQSGHFVGTPTCTDQGTTVRCTGKVAGLGGTTFEITVDATPAGTSRPGRTPR